MQVHQPCWQAAGALGQRESRRYWTSGVSKWPSGNQGWLCVFGICCLLGQVPSRWGQLFSVPGQGSCQYSHENFITSPPLPPRSSPQVLTSAHTQEEEVLKGSGFSPVSVGFNQLVPHTRNCTKVVLGESSLHVLWGDGQSKSPEDISTPGSASELPA